METKLKDLITILLSLDIPIAIKASLAAIVLGIAVMFVTGCSQIGEWETSIVAASQSKAPPTSQDTSPKSSPEKETKD